MTLSEAINESKRLVHLKNAAVSWQVIKAYNVKIENLKTLFKDENEKALKQVPTIREALKFHSSKGKTYYPENLMTDSDIIEEWYHPENETKTEIFRYIEINSVGY